VEIVLQCQVEVGERLRLDPLGGVDEQDGTLTGRQAATNLVREVDVARGVDHVQHGLCALAGALADPPRHPDRLAFDRDAPLALDVHPVQVLVPHQAGVDHLGELQHPVGQRGLSVVDVGNDAEVPDMTGVGGARFERRWHGRPFR
jgi:hypothetical protein